MSAIVGPMTPGRIAFALGSIGVGALVGTAIADHRDQDIGKGALFGGLAAVAGLGLLYGGAYAWNRFSAARTGASAGVSQLSGSLARFTTPAAATTAAPALGRTASRLQLPPAASFFGTAPSVAVPSIARTPALPVAASSGGGAFLDALRGFMR